jgi:hypothetical protein
MILKASILWLLLNVFSEICFVFYVLLLNAFQHDRIVLKRGRVILEINPFEALRS